jgi:hypothetical protein
METGEFTMKKLRWLLIPIILFLAWISFGLSLIGLWEYGLFNLCYFLTLLSCTWFYYDFKKTSFISDLALRKYRQNLLIQACLWGMIFSLLHFFSSKQTEIFDLTRQHLNQLQSGTVNYFSQLKNKQVKMTFVGTSEQWRSKRRLLQKYAQLPSVQLEWVNPDKQIELTERLGVKKLPAIIISANQITKSPEEITEVSITTLVKQLFQQKQHYLCFVQDHHELALEDSSPMGLSSLKNFLHQEAYLVNKVSISEVEALMACELFFILGPKEDFLPEELARLETELKNGKSLFIALDPFAKNSYLSHLRQWLTGFGIVINGHMLLDVAAQKMGNEPVNIIWDKEAKEGSDKNFAALMSSQWDSRLIWQLATFIELQASEKGHVDSMLLSKPFPQVWAESDWKSLESGKVRFQEGEDTAGPLILMAKNQVSKEAALYVQSSSRLWVNGMDSFPAQLKFLQLFLAQHFTKSSSEKVLDTALVRPEPLWFNEQQMWIIFYLSCVVFPLLFIFIAYMYYLRKRES